MAVMMPKVTMPGVQMPGVQMPGLDPSGGPLDGPAAPDPSIHTEKSQGYVSKLAGLSGAKPASRAEQFVNGFNDPMTDYYAQVKDPRQAYADSTPMIEHNLHNPMWDEFLSRLGAASTKNTKPATGVQ